MLKKSFAVLCAVFALSACVSDTQTKMQDAGKGQTRIGSYLVGWNDVFRSAFLKGLHPEIASGLAPDESIFLFTAYNPSDPSMNSDRPSIVLSNGTRVHGDIKSCDYLLSTPPRAKEQALHQECRDKMANQPTASAAAQQPTGPSFSELIRLAEQGVAAEGTCQWLGYDKTLDASMRSRGGLASPSDKRLFFAKLRCSWLPY